MNTVKAKLRFINNKSIVFSDNKHNRLTGELRLLNPDLYLFRNSLFECELSSDNPSRVNSFKLLDNGISKKLNKVNEFLLKLTILEDYLENIFSIVAINDALDVLMEKGYKTENLREAMKTTVSKTGVKALHELVKTKVNCSDFEEIVKVFFDRRGSEWLPLKKEVMDMMGWSLNTSEPICSNDSKCQNNASSIEFTDFSKKSSEIKIFLDESWPKDSDEGIIAGIIWDGDKINSNLLPKRETHRSTTSYLENDPVLLKKCSRALPFILKVNEKDYKKLLTKSLKFILGWLLPQDGYPCNVSVYMEAFTSEKSQFGPNADWTDFFEAIIYEAKNANKSRYQRWKIKKAKCVAKNYEYVAWGDLLAYFGLAATEEVRNLIKVHKIDEWIGNVHIDSWLEQKLADFDAVKFNFESYIDLLTNGENKGLFVSKLITYLSKRIEQDENLANELINTLDNKYFSEKSKSVEELQKVLMVIENKIPNLAKTSYARKRLKWLVFLIKDANHHGNIEKVQELLSDYNKTKALVIENDRELVMRSDLDVFVHYCDNFDFEAALSFIKNLKNSPAFPFISLVTRAKISSCYGQALALNQRYQEAEDAFKEALDYLNLSDLNADIKVREIHQTSIYRLTNAWDGNLSNKNIIFKETLGKPEVCYKKLSLGELDDFYDIHLLLKLAYFNEDLRKHYIGVDESSYIFAKTSFHPWQFIYLYIALLSNSKADKETYLKKSLSICLLNNQGATMKFIGFMLKFLSIVIFDREANDEALFEVMMKYVQKYIPNGEEILKKALDVYNGNASKDQKEVNILKILRTLLKGRADLSASKDQKVINILKLLPFNYH